MIGKMHAVMQDSQNLHHIVCAFLKHQHMSPPSACAIDVVCVNVDTQIRTCLAAKVGHTGCQIPQGLLQCLMVVICLLAGKVLGSPSQNGGVIVLCCLGQPNNFHASARCAS